MVIVLAMDGLECAFAQSMPALKKLDMDHECRRVPEEYIHPVHGIPLTPTIWTSVLTGLKPREHGIYDFTAPPRPVQKTLVRTRLSPPHVYRIGRAFAKLRLAKPVDLGKLGYKTLFDLPGSCPSTVPFVNEPSWPHLGYALLGGRELARFLTRVHEYRVAKLFSILRRGGCGLVFAWFDLTDIAGHYYYDKTFYRIRVHLMVSGLIEKVARHSPRAKVLVISDHGMKRGRNGVGEHSDHYFIATHNMRVSMWPRDFAHVGRKLAREVILG